MSHGRCSHIVIQDGMPWWVELYYGTNDIPRFMMLYDVTRLQAMLNICIYTFRMIHDGWRYTILCSYIMVTDHTSSYIVLYVLEHEHTMQRGYISWCIVQCLDRWSYTTTHHAIRPHDYTYICNVITQSHDIWSYYVMRGYISSSTAMHHHIWCSGSARPRLRHHHHHSHPNPHPQNGVSLFNLSCNCIAWIPCV